MSSFDPATRSLKFQFSVIALCILSSQCCRMYNTTPAIASSIITNSSCTSGSLLPICSLMDLKMNEGTQLLYTGKAIPQGDEIWVVSCQVLGIPWDVDTEGLRQYMMKFGQLDDIIVMKVHILHLEQRNEAMKTRKTILSCPPSTAPGLRPPSCC